MIDETAMDDKSALYENHQETDDGGDEVLAFNCTLMLELVRGAYGRIEYHNLHLLKVIDAQEDFRKSETCPC
jgi:hypothetical protein